ICLISKQIYNIFCDRQNFIYNYMSQVTNDFNHYTVQISKEWNISATQSTDIDYTPHLNEIDEELSYSIIDLELVEKLTSFSYVSIGETETRFLTKHYRISRNGNSWTEWLVLDEVMSN